MLIPQTTTERIPFVSPHDPAVEWPADPNERAAAEGAYGKSLDLSLLRFRGQPAIFWLRPLDNRALAEAGEFAPDQGTIEIPVEQLSEEVRADLPEGLTTLALPRRHPSYRYKMAQLGLAQVEHTAEPSSWQIDAGRRVVTWAWVGTIPADVAEDIELALLKISLVDKDTKKKPFWLPGPDSGGSDAGGANSAGTTTESGASTGAKDKQRSPSKSTGSD